MERRPDVAPHPASESDPAEFEVLWAGEPGPIPDNVARDLQDLSDAIGDLGDDDGIIGTRFGQRVIVAPVGSPEEAVDIADVDPSRKIVLTLGGRDPTPAGALLAQVLSLRQDLMYGYASAPEIEGPTMEVLHQMLPALKGGQGAKVEGYGLVALGRHAEGVRGSLEGLLPDEEDEEETNRFESDVSDELPDDLEPSRS